MNSKMNHRQAVGQALSPARSGAEGSVPHLLYRLFSHSPFLPLLRQGLRQEWLCYTALVAAVLLGAGTALAQSSPAAPPDPKAAPAPGATGLSRPAGAAVGSPQAQAAPATPAIAPAAKARGGGEQEGIKVHGHWTIVVKDPDGTVTDRREFENSLSLGGVYLIANMVGGFYLPGAWAVSLGQQLSPAILSSEQYSTGPCGGASFTVGDVNPYGAAPSSASYNPNTSQGNCFIGEPYGAYGNPSVSPAMPCSAITGCSPTLTRQPARQLYAYATPTSVAQAGGFQLSGTAVATQNGTIDTVAALAMYCSSPLLGEIATTDPGSCDAGTTSRGNLIANVENIFFLGHSIPVGQTVVGQNFSATVLSGASPTSTPPAPVNVVANQTIQVTVLFSFN